MIETGLTSTTATTIGHIHNCLNEFSTLLKEVIILTRNHETGSRQRQFFLIGYNHRRGYSKRLHGDPKECPEGVDLKWQLRNIRWHLKHYAELMNLYEDVLDDLTGFLLDTTFKCYLGSTRLNEVVSDPDLFNDCIEVCKELASAIEESEFYQNLNQNAVEVKVKLDELQQFVAVQGKALVMDSQMVLNFVQNTLLLEIKKENSTFNKPVTKHLLDVIVPQLVKNAGEDSGIVYDLLTSTPSTPSLPRDSLSKKSTPVPRRNKAATLKQESTPISSRSLMDTSMVIVDTPVLKNKHIEQVKETTPRSRRKNKNREERKNGDSMDGSFVLI
jgi:hypothetical protein